MSGADAAAAPPRIRRVLLANRGEVVIRIAKTLRFMGIESVAVYTDADAGAPFTRATDAATCLGENRNYLNITEVVRAGKRMGCDAVHPGYGFLAENADFADAVVAAGMIFIGPTAESIRALGSKAEAKRLLQKDGSGVPVIPGYLAEPGSQSAIAPAAWAAKADEVGYPVLIKAAAGGGGKGMRVVRRKEDFLASYDAVITEAKGAFGDSTVLLERYFEDVRHIEVQIMGDQYGDVIHLFERECSIQRRHQKLLEECPAASLDISLRQRICDAAVRVGKAARYRNAGTVEFIVDAAKGEFFFLEVNTRLQVEHAVTELCTGVDIVSTQVLVAQGWRAVDAVAASRRRSDVYQGVLPAPSTVPLSSAVGFAIEARVYAEDDNFAPSIGTVTAVAESCDAEYHTTVAPGTSVGVHYDGLLTKVIAYSTSSRAAAIDALIAGLRNTVIFGVQQANRKALIRLLQHPLVVSGRMATNLIDKGAIDAAYLRASLSSKGLAGCATLSDAQRDCGLIAAAIACEAIAERNATERRPAGPWRQARRGWTNTRAGQATAPKLLIASHDQTMVFEVTPQYAHDASKIARSTVTLRQDAKDPSPPTDIRISVDWTAPMPSRLRPHPDSRGLKSVSVTHYDSNGAPVFMEAAVTQITKADGALWAADDATKPVLEIVHVHLFESGNSFSFGIVDRHAGNAMVSAPPTGSLLPANYGTQSMAAAAALAGEDGAAGPADAATAANVIAVRSPIPAKVVRVELPSGTAVKKDQVVVVLESMKMETKVAAPADGTLTVKVKAGDMVQGTKVLFEIATDPK
jgi:acetyl/propionyl-CoA carboxylase alpha subunit